VDDGSDDGETRDVCASLAGAHVRVVRQENRGLPAARNRGAEIAAEIGSARVVFLDADDWLEPAFVRTLGDKLDLESGEDELVSHAYCQERLVELGVGVWRVPEWDPLMLMITNLHPVTCLVWLDRFMSVGGFDETMTGGYEDWDLWLKFAERGWRGVRVREPLFVWRRHSHETMIMKVIHDHERLYRRIIENHRALYESRLGEALLTTQSLVRRYGLSRIDERGEPVRLSELEGARALYERMAAVRAHHFLHRLTRAAPRPLAGTLRGGMSVARAVARRLAPARGMLPRDLSRDRLHST
jgi:glycosyltransferase involved in cell wall biosynthesis